MGLFFESVNRLEMADDLPGMTVIFYDTQNGRLAGLESI